MKTNLRSIVSNVPGTVVSLVVALAFGCCCVVTAGKAATPDIVWQTNAHDVVSVAFSSDGLYLASGAEDNTAIVWAWSNRTAVAVVTTPAKVNSIALPPAAAFFVTGGDDGATRNWSTATGTLNCGSRPNNSIVWSVAISSDGSLLAVGRSDGSLNLGSTPCIPGGLSLDGHTRDVFAVAFSPDGLRMASASGDGTARIWRVSDGSLLHILAGHSIFETNEDDMVFNAVRSVDFSPDNALLLATADDGTARVWRVSDGQQVRVLGGGGGIAGKFSADGKTLYTVGGGTIKFWRVTDGRLLATFDNTSANSLAVCPDRQHFAYGTAGGLVLARVPLWIEQVEHTANQLILRWQGGSGRYQLQRAANVATGPWENVGSPTTATAATNTVTATMFYRVQNLPNP